MDGCLVGCLDGCLVGCDDGLDGCAEGRRDGIVDGCPEGNLDGHPEGMEVGKNVGGYWITSSEAAYDVTTKLVWFTPSADAAAAMESENDPDEIAALRDLVALA